RSERTRDASAQQTLASSVTPRTAASSLRFSGQVRNAGCCNGCCNAYRRAVDRTRNGLLSSSDLGDPCGIRTRDLYLERVASWAARRTGLGAAAPAFAASGVYAILFADHEAHAADGVRHAADLVVDDSGRRADQDQVTLIDI